MLLLMPAFNSTVQSLGTYFQLNEVEIASSSSPEQRSNYTFVIRILSGSLLHLRDEYARGFVTTCI